MTKAKKPAANAGLSLQQISEAAGISIPALIKYKKGAATNGLKRFMLGEGRSATFKKSAIPTFLKLRNQGLKQRGRPSKSK